MKIVICGSINFAGDMKRIKEKLEKSGHKAVIPESVYKYNIESSKDAEELKKKGNYINQIKPYATIKHFDEIKDSDAIFVVNMKKHGIENYIGGATFAEIMFAFYYKKKIFLLNPIPKDKRLRFIADEIESVQPVVINGDLSLVK